MSSRLAQRRADQKDRDRERLVRAATVALRSFVPRLETKILTAYRTGGQVDAVTRDAFDAFNEALGESMLMSDLKSRAQMLESHRRTARAIRLDRNESPALKALRERLNLKEFQVESLRRTYGAAATDATGVLQQQVVDAATKAIREAIDQGATTRAGTELVREAMTKAGLSSSNPYYFENIFRTETAKAYGAAQWKANDDPAIAEVLWGYEYVTVGDDRVRPAHAEMDGVRAPKDDPVWQRWFPPNGFGCRCAAVEIFAEDPESLRRATDVPDVQPDAGFDVNFGAVLVGA